VGLSIFEESAPLYFKKQLLPADAFNVVPIMAAQKVALRIDSLSAISTDTAARYASLVFTDSAGDAFFGQVQIAALAGIGGVPLAEFVSALASPTIGGFVLPPGVAVGISMAATITADKSITFTILGGYF
jgi:hypothetical protein